MAKVGNSIIKDVDINEIISLLNRAYADEWLAYYQYYIEAKVIKGIMKDSIIAELNEHAADELRHTNMIADRILQLGGTPILNPNSWSKYANCAYEEPKSFNVISILEDAIKGEQCAIQTYNKIVNLTRDKDIVTYDIVSEILSDEVEHEEDLIAMHEDITQFIENLKGDLR
jgi:bacterioferritin